MIINPVAGKRSLTWWDCLFCQYYNHNLQMIGQKDYQGFLCYITYIRANKTYVSKLLLSL